MELKYIIIKNNMGIEDIVLFPKSLIHSDVSAGRDVFGAGFCRIPTDGSKPYCYGESISLQVESRCDVDSGILRIALMRSRQPEVVE